MQGLAVYFRKPAYSELSPHSVQTNANAMQLL